MGNQILLVDDNLDLLESIEDSLKIRGYSTITATNGFEAVQKFDENEPCMVFMDIKMPKMDGYEAFSKIIEKNKNAKVIFISGYIEYPKIDACKNKGLLGMLKKPAETQKIVELIKENGC